MPFLWTMLGLALAQDLSAPEDVVRGFDRLHSDPAMLHVEPQRPELPVRRASLVIDNGHSARATVTIGDTAVGELLPRAQGVLHDVVAGTYSVRFTLPGGAVRVEQVRTRPAAEVDRED